MQVKPSLIENQFYLTDGKKLWIYDVRMVIYKKRDIDQL